jgi:ATP phosphoribosyltransferase regulatory subunit HisZ
MMVGSVIPGLAEACTGRGGPADSADEDYVHRLVADYGLDPAQERLLRLVLQSQSQDELQAFRAADFESLPEALKGQLRLARGRTVSRTRALLSADQRQRYDAQLRNEAGR